MGNIFPTIVDNRTMISAPVYKEDRKIDFVSVSEDIEVSFILERYLPGAGAA